MIQIETIDNVAAKKTNTNGHHDTNGPPNDINNCVVFDDPIDDIDMSHLSINDIEMFEEEKRRAHGTKRKRKKNLCFV